MYKGRSPDMRYVSPQNEENVEGQRGVYAVDYFRGKPVWISFLREILMPGFRYSVNPDINQQHF